MSNPSHAGRRDNTEGECSMKTKWNILLGSLFIVAFILMFLVSQGVSSLFQPKQTNLVAVSQPLVIQEDLPADDTMPRSSERIFPSEWEGPGSGHAFAYGVVYEIKRIDVGQPVHIRNAVWVSGEPGVEIWSPIKELIELPVGTKFQLKEGGEAFAESLEVIKRGS